MDGDRARQVKAEIVRLSHSILDSSSLSLSAERLLRTVIPFDFACWHNVDPATSMLTSVMGEAPPTDPMLAVLEYGTLDVNQYSAVARTSAPAAGLRLATRNEPEASRRYREVLRPLGVEDELTAAFVVDSMFWGCARLYRTKRWPPFDSSELRFVSGLCSVLAEGFRRALIAPGVMVQDSFHGPGVLVLDEQGNLESITPGAKRLLSEIVDVVPIEAGILPRPVQAVAARLRAIASADEAEASLARCRVPTRSGEWLVLHAAQMQGEKSVGTAVIIERAPAAELASLIVRAYGLTEREREVAQYALRGLATKEIAQRLKLSPYTVSDHLRVVFEKVSVNSRTELASRIFFDHYYPHIGEGPLPGNSGWFMN